MTRNGKILFIIANSAILIMGTIAIAVQLFAQTGKNSVDSNGITAFNYFTNDGNIFCMLVALYALIIGIKALVCKEDIDSKKLYLAYLASTVSALIIFLVVVFILTPQFGIGIMQGYNMFVLHVSNPLLILVTFLLFTRTSNKISLLETTIGFLPVLVYAITSMSLCICEVWEEKLIPYPFLDVYNNPIWMSILYFILIVGGAYGLSVLLNFINKKISSRIAEE